MNNKKKSNKSSKKTKGGSLTYAELADTKNLGLNKSYPDRNLNQIVRNIKVSNFVGGTLARSYTNYKNGKKSNMRKYKGGGVADNALTISVSDTYNYSGLGLPKDYKIDPVTKITRVPHSKLALY